MPIGTGTAISGAVVAYLAKDGINKLIGPTFNYVGNEVKDFVEQQHKNFSEIVENAKSKIGDDIEKNESIPPKVMKAILDDGTLSDDPVSIEYFGGVMASSRSPISRDDRGARIAKLISNMSSYQIRAHCILYTALHKKFHKSDTKLGTDAHRNDAAINLDYELFAQVMDFSDQEITKGMPILTHIFHGLYTEGLIGRWGYGDKEGLAKTGHKVIGENSQIRFAPTAVGVELYLWAYGKGKQSNDYIFQADFNPKFLDQAFENIKPL